MNQPVDPRPTVNYRTVVRERGISYAASRAIAGLFENAGTAALDIDSIRFRLSVPDDPDHDDTVLYVKARVGAPPCPRCHQPGDRPHTDYCPTRCTCPPEQLILGHAARCPVRAADPWENGEIKVTGTIPVVPCTDLDCPVTNPHRHAGNDVILNSADVRGLPLDEWAAKHHDTRLRCQDVACPGIARCSDPDCRLARATQP